MRTAGSKGERAPIASKLSLHAGHDAAAGAAAGPDSARGPAYPAAVQVDPITGFSTAPLAVLAGRPYTRLGVIYLRIGRLSGEERHHGVQAYDRLLALASESLRRGVEQSSLRESLIGIVFSGTDGFFVLFDLEHSSLGSVLRAEANRLRDAIANNLAKRIGLATGGVVAVHARALQITHDPRVRRERGFLRALDRASRSAAVPIAREQGEMLARFRSLVLSRQLVPRFQPVVDIAAGRIAGYEALIRGPEGSDLETPDTLFAAAREGGLEIELETLCLERIFENLPAAIRGKILFVNASARLLSHTAFLDARNLARLKKAHPRVVVEISEKEVVWDYASFHDVLATLRAQGFEIAIDDAGSGYSGLESILQIRPRYIKVAESIVRGLESDPLKREIILALQSLARQIRASVVAEGIERPEEKKALKALGVMYGQGFLFGQPRITPQRTLAASSPRPRAAR